MNVDILEKNLLVVVPNFCGPNHEPHTDGMDHIQEIFRRKDYIL